MRVSYVHSWITPSLPPPPSSTVVKIICAFRSTRLSEIRYGASLLRDNSSFIGRKVGWFRARYQAPYTTEIDYADYGIITVICLRALRKFNFHCCSPLPASNVYFHVLRSLTFAIVLCRSFSSLIKLDTSILSLYRRGALFQSHGLLRRKNVHGERYRQWPHLRLDQLLRRCLLKKKKKKKLMIKREYRCAITRITRRIVR